MPFDMRPITITVPAFALGALAHKTREWAEQMQRDQRDEAAAAWYETSEQIEKGLGTANATAKN